MSFNLLKGRLCLHRSSYRHMAVIPLYSWAECTYNKSCWFLLWKPHRFYKAETRLWSEDPTWVRQKAHNWNWNVLAQCKCSRNGTVFIVRISGGPSLPLQWSDSQCQLCSEPASAPVVQDWAFSQGRPTLAERKEADENTRTFFGLWVTSEHKILLN